MIGNYSRINLRNTFFIYRFAWEQQRRRMRVGNDRQGTMGKQQ